MHLLPVLPSLEYHTFFHCLQILQISVYQVQRESIALPELSEDCGYTTIEAYLGIFMFAFKFGFTDGQNSRRLMQNL